MIKAYIFLIELKMTTFNFELIDVNNLMIMMIRIVYFSKINCINGLK